MSVDRYDKQPTISVSSTSAEVSEGWDEALVELAARLAQQDRCVLAVDCYPGVDVAELRAALEGLRPRVVLETDDALLPPSELEHRLRPYLGDDPVFGYLTPLALADLFSPERLARLADQLARHRQGIAVVLGVGATLVAPAADVLVYADLTRWEIQKRQRRHEIGTIGMTNASAPSGELYKRSFFVDWRVADRHRHQIYDRIDYYLDTNEPSRPRMIPGDLYRRAMRAAGERPFRLVPFFDPGPWGGEWMRRHFDLPPDPPNFAWCFDCVPEENSLLFGFGSRTVQSPALTLVHEHPVELLGRGVHDRFGAEFPIRFDLLDTMEGGNLSLQVHPLAAYISEHFGMSYTQDESYYLLAAAPGARVYLGLKSGVDRERFATELTVAQDGGPPFDADRYVNAWPARPHDHFSIPAGTIHCSGKDNVVLEISATPYIFTFKLWDWGRVGLDGEPRPTHVQHGLANIQWERTTEWVAENLIDRVRPVGEGAGWREESTGLHPLEFIETRRHWFTDRVDHHTKGTVNVLNLVQGQGAVVESPAGAFDPMPVRYAETFVVPAAVGAYTIRPLEGSAGELATIKASIRSS